MPCRFRHSPSKRRAVTFLELMVVLIIIMVFVGMSFPMLRGIHRKSQLAAAAREFAMTSRLARQQAILRHRTVEIRIDFRRDRYWLDVDPEERRRVTYSSTRDEKEEFENIHQLEKKRGGPRIHSVQSATDPFGSDQLVRVKFFKDGSATPTTVLFANDKPRYMSVEIAGATGNVRAFEGKPEGWESEEGHRRRGRRARR